MLNIEKKTKGILTAVFIVAFAGLVFSTYGKTEFILYSFGILSILFGLVLWGEGGWVSWLIRKGYKSWNPNDFLVIGSFVFGTVLIISGILVFPFIRESSPMWLINFLAPIVAVSSLIGLILSLWFLWSPKPKA